MKKKNVFFILIVVNVLTLYFSLQFRLNYFLTELLVFGVPGFLLLILNREKIKKILTTVLVAVLTVIPIFEILLHHNKLWIADSIFPEILFGYSAVENILWAFLVFNYILSFYEFFINNNTSKVRIKTRTKLLIKSLVAINILFAVVFFLKPEIFITTYIYIIFGTTALVLPTVIYLSTFPNMILKISPVLIYFLLLFLPYIYVVLSLQHWEYNQHALNVYISINNLRFPLEEFIFWMIFTVPTSISLYEYFVDDNK